MTSSGEAALKVADGQGALMGDDEYGRVDTAAVALDGDAATEVVERVRQP